ncbi:MAG: hypothetical protein WCT10_05430 [Patescibacteria group bacterium]|jgi:hypothetical protein
MSKPNISKPQLLEKINAVLQEFDLPLWNEAHLGDAETGQREIVDLLDFQEQGPGRVRISFLVETSDRGQAKISINFGPSLICVVPYLRVNQGEASDKRWKIGLIKRWLVGGTEWTFELPRGTDPNPAGKNSEVDSPAHRVLTSILGEEFREWLATDKVESLGEFRLDGENSPTRAYLIRARVVQPGRRKRGDGELVLMEPAQLLTHVRSSKFMSDVLTSAVLFRATLRIPQL